MADDLGYSLDWDQTEAEDRGFQLLDPGTYQFQVNDLRRERYEGGQKIGACPKAIICLTLMTDTGIATMEESLLLNSKVEWRIARFFEGLGYTKDPETGKVPIRWNEVIGKTGWLNLGVREFVKKDGSKGTANEVEEFLPPDKWPTQSGLPAMQPAPAVSAQTQVAGIAAAGTVAPTAAMQQAAMPLQAAPQQVPGHNSSAWSMQ